MRQGQALATIDFPKLDRASRFLARFASRLAPVINCYQRDFSFKHSQIHHRLATIANNWARLSYQFGVAKDLSKWEADKPTENELQGRFTTLAHETDKLVEDVIQDLKNRHSRCGITSTDQKKVAHAEKRDIRDLTDDFIVHLPELFANGYVITFIATMLKMTHEPAHVIAYMEDMEKYLDPSGENLTGRINYYFNMASTRDDYDYWTSADADLELAKAQALVELINAAYGAPGKLPCSKPGDKLDSDAVMRIWPYYCGLRVYFINLRALNLIRDWLEGREVSSGEVAKLKDWNREMLNWINSGVSVTSMDEHDSGLPPWIANVYDTLAVSELAIASIENDVSQAKCARAGILLLQSKAAWDKLKSLRTAPRPVSADTASLNRRVDPESLRKKFDREQYQAAIHIYEAHQELRRAVCS